MILITVKVIFICLFLILLFWVKFNVHYFVPFCFSFLLRLNVVNLSVIKWQHLVPEEANDMPEADVRRPFCRLMQKRVTSFFLITVKIPVLNYQYCFVYQTTQVSENVYLIDCLDRLLSYITKMQGDFNSLIFELDRIFEVIFSKEQIFSFLL